MDPKGERSIRELMELFPLSGILLFIVIAAPWYVLAAARTGGDLISGFIMEHNIGRFLKPMERHSGPIFYYLPVLLAGFYPWAVFLPQAVKEGLRKAELADRYPGFMRLQVIWAAIVLIFFSIARTKLPNYILPSFPALAFLTGAWIETVVRTPEAGYSGRSVSWAVNIIPALFFPVLFFVAFKLRAPDFTSMAWIALPMAAPALLGLILHLRRVAPFTMSRAVAYTAAVGVLLVHTVLLPHLEPLRVSPRMGRTIAQHAGPGDSVASFGYDRPALFFYGKRPVVKVMEEDSLRLFLALPEGRFVVTTLSRYEQLPVDLKDSLRILEEGLDALDTNKVVLVAERTKSRAQSPESRGK
jgi:4-amino-4-deoxy-L-arabinose transferase-like glycosyltransferase